MIDHREKYAFRVFDRANRDHALGICTVDMILMFIQIGEAQKEPLAGAQ